MAAKVETLKIQAEAYGKIANIVAEARTEVGEV
jgi:hypothetical protein